MSKREHLFWFIFLLITASFTLPSLVRAVVPYDFGASVLYMRDDCEDGTGVMLGPPGSATSYGESYFFLEGFSEEKPAYYPPQSGQVVMGQSDGYMICLYECDPYVCEDLSASGPIVWPNAGSIPL